MVYENGKYRCAVPRVSLKEEVYDYVVKYNRWLDGSHAIWSAVQEKFAVDTENDCDAEQKGRISTLFEMINHNESFRAKQLGCFKSVLLGW